MKRVMMGAVLMWMAAAPAAQSQLSADDIREHAADPYIGSLKLGLFGPDGKRVVNQSGEADLAMSFISGGLLDLTLEGVVPESGNTKITAKLKPDGKGGWADTGDKWPMFISPEGVISGSGLSDRTQITYSGQITDVRLELTVKANYVDAQDNGIPAGSSIQQEFSLQRKGLAQARRAALGPGGDCEKMVMQPRHIANLGGGGMSMIMVPVCLPAVTE